MSKARGGMGKLYNTGKKAKAKSCISSPNKTGGSYTSSYPLIFIGG